MAIFHSKLFAGPNIVFNGDLQPDITIVAGDAENTSVCTGSPKFGRVVPTRWPFPPCFRNPHKSMGKSINPQSDSIKSQLNPGICYSKHVVAVIA